ncbi:cytidylyltransferase domain-containing protein [Blastochloris tepida]|uniref:Flagellin modification protein FlmC n=1 Tax=Blastochloris tepida TaxID=2233851 RepID=A0A348FVN2_9HYPH|nr:glycosyltransferase family protein [Blastochloris tepida]BBF91365.1 flagellin modification protein FlmC [Blastochloris tepida]
MTTAIIVQARMTSTRLPGKVMMDLAGKPALSHVLERCRAVVGADIVVCAVPDAPESALIVETARALGCAAVAGDETDVLGRYLAAARAVSADVVMRVTSDCPLIDPAICADVLALRARTGADYAANNLTRTFPHGLDCEAFTTEALARADRATAEPFDREHVTPWLRRTLNGVNLAAADPSHVSERWTLDHPEDLAFLRAVFARLPTDRIATTADVLAVLAAEPSLRDINAMHRQY